MQVVQSKDQVIILAMNWIQKYKVVIDMNKKQIIFQVDERKFTTKLVSNIKPQNKVHYYIMNELENIIDFIIIEDDIMKGDDKGYPIMIDSEENDTSSEDKSETKQISRNLKGKFLDEAIVFYKNKCRQYID